jgi:hypothetical protein
MNLSGNGLDDTSRIGETLRFQINNRGPCSTWPSPVWGRFLQRPIGPAQINLMLCIGRSSVLRVVVLPMLNGFVLGLQLSLFFSCGAGNAMAAAETIHNPDRYMSDLRQILSQGRKRIGLLVGAGAPTAIRLSSATGKIDEAGEALIPDVTHLTEFVIGSLKEKNAIVVAALRKDLIPTFGALPNIEAILSRIRLLSQAIGSETVHGLNASEFEGLGKTICELIGTRVTLQISPHPGR